MPNPIEDCPGCGGAGEVLCPYCKGMGPSCEACQNISYVPCLECCDPDAEEDDDASV